jgi:hypothetical protein
MSFKKEIIVVAPDQYKDLARRLVHEISKINGCNGAFWSIKQFEDNEFQLGGNRYAIFIGSPEENILTKGFKNVIDNVVNNSGACFGMDGTKAVVYGDGKLRQDEDINDLLNKSKKVLREFKEMPWKGNCCFGLLCKGQKGENVGLNIASASVIFSPVQWVFNEITYSEIKLREDQTKAAMTFFLTEHFDVWAGLENREP